MKGGMQFADDKPPEYGDISLYGNGNGDEQKNLQFKKKEVQTHSKLKDGTHLKFTLYNIEPFHEYEKTTFDLSNLLGDDINSIEHLYLCGFLTGWEKKEFFIKKGKVGDEGNKTENNKKLFEEIGKALNKICSDKIKYSEKIQIILAHSTEKKTLCIIFNMSGIDSKWYDLLKKKYLPDTSFSDEKILEKKIETSQLENLIEFTNEYLPENSSIAYNKLRLLESLLFVPQREISSIAHNKLRLLESLLFVPQPSVAEVAPSAPSAPRPSRGRGRNAAPGPRRGRDAALRQLFPLPRRQTAAQQQQQQN